MSDEGDFERDYYYLYVDIEVQNIGKTAKSFTALDFVYIPIDKDNIATYTYDTEDNPYYVLETDGKNLINFMMVIMPFESNDSCKYTVCYIVPDETLEEDNLYVYRTEGLYGRSLSADKDIQYVKLDIQ